MRASKTLKHVKKKIKFSLGLQGLVLIANPLQITKAEHELTFALPSRVGTKI